MAIKLTNLFSNFKTAKTSAANQQQIQGSADESVKSDKKAAAIVGGLAALALTGTVAAAAIIRHKVPGEIRSALNNFKATNKAANSLIESAKKQADEAVEYGQKLFDEVTELLKKGNETAPDGTVLRKITGDDTNKIMEEFSQDGTLLRRSEFIDDILDNVEEGIEEFADGSRKIAKKIYFVDEMPSWYQEGYEKLADGAKRIAKGISLENGKPSRYQEGIEKVANEADKIAKAIEFTDGQPSRYQEGLEGLTGWSWKAAKTLDFKDGQPIKYQEDIKELGNVAKAIEFTDGKPIRYQEGIDELAGWPDEVVKRYELGDKGWQEVSE